MNISVSMATNTSGMNNMNQMTGQISMTSATSVPTSGLSSMGPEQVRIEGLETTARGFSLTSSSFSRPLRWAVTAVSHYVSFTSSLEK